ncbi:hypothetical protein TSOC_007362, partial [Tetrabaena socialis]
YYVIIQGATSDSSDDRILDVKLQGKPSVYPYLTATAKAAVDNAVANDADRAVKAYKALIKGADNHLGWMNFQNGYYSVRERSPFKEDLDTTAVSLSSLTNLAEQWGWVLANGHARSDGGLYGTPTSIESIVYSLTSGIQDTFKTEVADFAIAYANQVATDFTLFRSSYATAGLSRRMLVTLYSVTTGTARSSTIETNLNSANKAIGATMCNQKMSQMNVSAFSFYRGSNELYYQDLKNQSIISATGSSFYSATATPWLQGDYHTQNMGTFDNDGGLTIYDLNDFDESFVGNYLYDVYRLAASIVLVGRESSMTDTDIRSCVRSFVNFYCDKMKGIYQGTISDSAVLTASNAYGRIINAAATDTRKKMLDKYSTVVNSTRTFMTNAQNSDLDAVNSTELTAITNAMTAYYTNTITSSLKGNSAYFAVQDAARRLNAGVGSLGKP